jgi:hypothetical protein
MVENRANQMRQQYLDVASVGAVNRQITAPITKEIVYDHY